MIGLPMNSKTRGENKSNYPNPVLPLIPANEEFYQPKWAEDILAEQIWRYFLQHILVRECFFVQTERPPHTLPQHPCCAWCTHGVKLWTLLKCHKLMSNIATLKIPLFFPSYCIFVFFFKFKMLICFVWFCLVTPGKLCFFHLLWASLCWKLDFETGVWFDWTFILSKTHTDDTTKTLRRKESSSIPPSHSAEVLSPHMALYAIPVDWLQD